MRKRERRKNGPTLPGMGSVISRAFPNDPIFIKREDDDRNDCKIIND